jgi:putative heme-binding domain-containing protein
MSLRAKIASTLGESSSQSSRAILLQSLTTAPTTLQKEIALALAGTHDGSEALLQAVIEGKTSPRLLQERTIADRLTASKIPDAAARIQKLTANLPAPSAERQKLIEQRHGALNLSSASTTAGAQVFKQQCSICHSLDGQGATIGPQLDGVGGRGAERIMEDILDPNRNVDRAFRTTLLIMKDGDVQSGLFRREEGAMLVLAQSDGKEISVPKKDVQERRESDTSLMPDNFSEAISASDFNNLIAFLLSKRPK